MNIDTAPTRVSTLAGTPKEVKARLGKSNADRVLVISFDHIHQTIFEAVASNFVNVASSMETFLGEQRDQELIERLAEALVSQKPAAPRLLKESMMLAHARKAVLESGDWLTATEISNLAGLNNSNPSSQPNKWKKQGQIFAIRHNGVDYFPNYGLDNENGFRPLKVLSKIIDIFSGHKDGWGMAYWFLSDNSFLGGKRPQDLLVKFPDQVIEAAQEEVQEIAHG